MNSIDQWREIAKMWIKTPYDPIACPFCNKGSFKVYQLGLKTGPLDVHIECDSCQAAMVCSQNLDDSE
jgi:hypothetical protein